MTNTPASLLKKITLKRNALAEAKAAHAVALAEFHARRAATNSHDNSAVFKACALVKRRAYALAGLEDALDSARHAAAAARRAADAALHDADMDATAEDRTAYARAVQADEEAAEAVAAAAAAPAAPLAGTGSAAQAAVNAAWNNAAAREAALHAADAAVDAAAREHGFHGPHHHAALAAYSAALAAHRLAIEAAEAEAEAPAAPVEVTAETLEDAARNARPGRVASVALAVLAFAVPVTLAAYALTPEPHRALAGALCGCLVGPALGIFLAARTARTAPPRAVVVEDARTAAHRARCLRAAYAARNA